MAVNDIDIRYARFLKYAKLNVYFSIFLRDFLNIFLHKNLLLIITNTTKKELVKSVQPFTRDAVTKENGFHFYIYRLYFYCTVSQDTYTKYTIK